MVHDGAQSFVLRLYIMHEFPNKKMSILVSSSVSSKQLLYFVRGQGQKKRPKTYNKKLWMLCRVALWTQMVEQRINSEV